MVQDEPVDEKSYGYSTAIAGDDVVFNGTEFGDQKDDVTDMKRLGKKQQFKVRWHQAFNTAFEQGLTMSSATSDSSLPWASYQSTCQPGNSQSLS
jgi:hypothetical protein